jgi:putative transposase
MSKKHDTLEKIVTKLRQVSVLAARGQPFDVAARVISATQATYHRWRCKYGALVDGQAWP